MGIKDFRHISTKKGDKGKSKSYSDESFPKDDILFVTIGTIDELSAFLGLTFHHTQYEQIKVIQKTLQAINSLVATNPAADARYQSLRQIGEQDIEFIETQEEKLLLNKEIETKFHLPGSETSFKNAYFDYSRTLARRAERTLTRFIREKDREDLAHCGAYLNRLSDLLFILARNFDNRS